MLCIQVAGLTAGTPSPASAGLASGLRTSFIEAMSWSATAVYVVTTNGPAGRHGLTVSAVSSVSADPPMLLVCINRASPISAAIRRNDVFAANLLADGQAELADVFAGRVSGRTRIDSFTADPWTAGLTGAPLLGSAVARFDCRLVAVHEAGTHAIFLGAVLQAGSSAGGSLLYHRRRYHPPGAAVAGQGGSVEHPSPGAAPGEVQPSAMLIQG